MSRKTQLFAVLGAVMLIVSMTTPAAAASAQDDVDAVDGNLANALDNESDDDLNESDDDLDNESDGDEEESDEEEEEDEEDEDDADDEDDAPDSATSDNLTISVTDAPSVELTDDGEAAANATVSVAVDDENASYEGAGEHTTDENGTVALPSPNETVPVTVTGEVDNRSVSVSTTLGSDAADNFGLEVSSFVASLQEENESGPMGQQVAAFVVENNPAADKIPDHAGPGNQGPPADKGPGGDQGPPEDKGPDGDNGPDGEKGPSEDKEQGPSEDKEQGPPEDKGPGGDDADSEQEDDSDADEEDDSDSDDDTDETA